VDTLHPTPHHISHTTPPLVFTPYTLHLRVYTLHPKPYTTSASGFTPFTLHLYFYTLYPKSHTLHHAPCTLHPKTSTRTLVARRMCQHSITRW